MYALCFFFLRNYFLAAGHEHYHTDYEREEKEKAEEKAERIKEKKRQQAVLGIKEKYGKNAILKGMNLEEGATAKNRNAQIGGHKA